MLCLQKILSYPTCLLDRLFLTLCTLLSNFLPGSKSVVVGDLMYCKENSSEIISAPTEYEDELSNEVAININVEEVDIIDVPDEKNIPVKVSATI
ncbi:hypothetical protein BVRB_014250 [Beta vulgaris subsp. vulgaris]|uniref:Uncharacterized protein n=1 Tax=Beta vulgaris subsp. vulgaris TaxID=3555 RepID=A0A0J8B1K4_BETVV|nr:hypothetical protein BVRB_014250 [Beta vulgaris subsp. vulgaris]